MENQPTNPKVYPWWSLIFWSVVAVFFVILFNFQDSLPKIMGFSGADMIAAVVVVAIWIATFAYSVMKRGPRG